jgi:hypothetical protein
MRSLQIVLGDESDEASDSCADDARCTDVEFDEPLKALQSFENTWHSISRITIGSPLPVAKDRARDAVKLVGILLPEYGIVHPGTANAGHGR